MMVTLTSRTGSYNTISGMQYQMCAQVGHSKEHYDCLGVNHPGKEDAKQNRTNKADQGQPQLSSVQYVPILPWTLHLGGSKYYVISGQRLASVRRRPRRELGSNIVGARHPSCANSFGSSICLFCYFMMYSCTLFSSLSSFGSHFDFHSEPVFVYHLVHILC